MHLKINTEVSCCNISFRFMQTAGSDECISDRRYSGKGVNISHINACSSWLGGGGGGNTMRDRFSPHKGDLSFLILHHQHPWNWPYSARTEDEMQERKFIQYFKVPSKFSYQSFQGWFNQKIMPKRWISSTTWEGRRHFLRMPKCEQFFPAGQRYIKTLI